MNNILNWTINTLISSAIISLSLLGCKSSSQISIQDISIEPRSGSIVKTELPIDFSYNSKVSFDSVVLRVGSQHFKLEDSGVAVKQNVGEQYGKIPFSVTFYRGSSIHIHNGVVIRVPKEPIKIDLKVIGSVAHTGNPHTQGLCIDNGVLYESSGEYGKSYIQKSDIKNGKVLGSVALESKYFAEGAVVLGDKLYVLTWKEGIVLVYDKNTLKQTDSFPWRGEGWGITTDGKVLYLSDGSSYIYTISPDDFSIVAKNEVYTNNGVVSLLNELEWINGYIYSNMFTTDYVLKINPKNWVVESVYIAKGLWEQRPEHIEEDVFNGIAHDHTTGKSYVTGKKWDKIYEVKF